MVLLMFFEALYFGHFLSFYTMQLEPPTGQEPSGPGHCTHVGRPRDRKEPIPHGSDALGRPSRPTGPVAGAVLQGHWSEPSQAASGTMANVTRSHGSNR